MCVVLLSGVQACLLTGCNDDLAAENYYTFTGEMMSDFLKTREDFSLFCRIVERAGEMDLMASRGARTLFAPVNTAVEAYLQEQGYASVEDIPAVYCDTLVKACLVDNTLKYTYDLQPTEQLPNELDLPLILVTNDTVLDANRMVVTVINRRASIINELKDDSVENGVVHPVDRVLVPSTSMGSALLDENFQNGNFTIWYEALSRTGLLDSLNRYRDDDYEVWKEEWDEFKTNIHSGNIFNVSDLANPNAGFSYHAKRPDHRYSGFTLLIVPDEKLYEKYPDRFNAGMTMDEKISALYQLAVEKYEGSESERIFGLDEADPADPEGRTYKDRYWNEQSLTDRHNPLNMFLSYHILDRMFTSEAKLVNCWGVNTMYADPTEWISTLLDYSMIKLEKVYNLVDPQVEKHTGFYVNHSAATKYNGGERVRGAILTTPGTENFSLNVAYYYLDDVVAYDGTMRNNVMNTRIRIDFSTMWPELTNNDIRLCGDPWGQPNHAPDRDDSEVGGANNGFNYYLPSGYLKDCDFSETTVFFVQRPKLEWWNWGGDEINILGSSYDVTFTLPKVPPGTYEFRLGYPGMVDRGIAQIYLDGVPQGIPIDMRYQADDPRVGGLYVPGELETGRRDDYYSAEVLEENARVMRNNGYYAGPRSCYTGLDYDTPVPTFDASSCYPMYNNHYTFRRKICDVVVRPHTDHKIRIRSVFTSLNRGCFILDYFEMVPISICGTGGVGEDDL